MLCRYRVAWVHGVVGDPLGVVEGEAHRDVPKGVVIFNDSGITPLGWAGRECEIPMGPNCRLLMGPGPAVGGTAVRPSSRCDQEFGVADAVTPAHQGIEGPT